MWSSLAALLKKLIGGFDWVYLVLLAGLLAAATLAHVRGLRLDAVQAECARRILAEQVAHNATRTNLGLALTASAQLQAALDSARNATGAVQDSLRDALAREAEAVSAAAARKRIMDQMRTQARPAAEAMEVVDDATRNAVAVRLNRPL